MTMPDAPPPAGGASVARVRYDVIGQGWQLFQQQAATWVIAMLLVFVVYCVVGLLLNFVPGGRWLGAIPGYLLPGGLFRMALKQMRGQQIAVGDVFNISDILGQLIVAGLITGIAVSIGMVLCIVPGIILGGLLMFGTLLVADKGIDGIVAVQTSFNTLKPQAGSATVFYLVIGLLGALGLLGCGVGLLITAPLSLLSVTVLYRDFFPDEVYSPPQTPDVPSVSVK